MKNWGPAGAYVDYRLPGYEKKSFQNDFLILKNWGPAGPYVDCRQPGYEKKFPKLFCNFEKWRSCSTLCSLLTSQYMEIKSLQKDFVILKNEGPAGPYVEYR